MNLDFTDRFPHSRLLQEKINKQPQHVKDSSVIKLINQAMPIERWTMQNLR